MNEFIMRLINTPEGTLKLGQTYPQVNSGMGKPIGLWYSINWEWVEWCREHKPDWIEDKIIMLGEVDESALCVLSSAEEVKAFHEKYVEPGHEFSYINWSLVAKDYKGIEIRNFDEIRNEIGFSLEYFWFTRFDVSSGCIWDTSIIQDYSMQDTPENKKKRKYATTAAHTPPFNQSTFYGHHRGMYDKYNGCD